jgi:lipopolysaccharide transport system ATP-binding protein
MINQGKIYASGSPNDVIIKYMKLVTEAELGIAPLEEEERIITSQVNDNTATPQKVHKQNLVKVKPTRRGSRKAIIENIKLFNQWGEDAGETPIFGFNEHVTLLVELQVYELLQSCIIGFFVCDKNGNELIGSNTIEENHPIGKLEPGIRLQIEFKFNLPLRTGSYSLTVAGAENYTAMTFDWIDNAMVFQVLPPDTGKRIHALVDTQVSVKVCQQTLPGLKTLDESMIV